LCYLMQVQCSAHLDIGHSLDCVAGQWTGVDTGLMFINVIKVFTMYYFVRTN